MFVNMNQDTIKLPYWEMSEIHKTRIKLGLPILKILCRTIFRHVRVYSCSHCAEDTYINGFCISMVDKFDNQVCYNCYLHSVESFYKSVDKDDIEVSVDTYVEHTKNIFDFNPLKIKDNF